MYTHKAAILIVVMAIISAIAALFFIKQKYPIIIATIPSFRRSTAESASVSSSSSPDTLYVIPNTLYLPVPFTAQAPTGNWDRLHNEACEEAVSIMAEQYFGGNPHATLPAALVESEINKLTAWQDQAFGYHLDTTSAETAQMITGVYGLRTKLIDNFTVDQLKNELAQNHLVIISEYGRALGNPYYKSPGPIHHMLLLTGFDGDNFITNDSGTKNGRNYIYAFDVLYSAAGNWSHLTNNVDQNKKIAILVWK